MIDLDELERTMAHDKHTSHPCVRCALPALLRVARAAEAYERACEEMARTRYAYCQGEASFGAFDAAKGACIECERELLAAVRAMREQDEPSLGAGPKGAGGVAAINPPDAEAP